MLHRSISALPSWLWRVPSCRQRKPSARPHRDRSPMVIRAESMALWYWGWVGRLLMGEKWRREAQGESITSKPSAKWCTQVRERGFHCNPGLYWQMGQWNTSTYMVRGGRLLRRDCSVTERLGCFDTMRRSRPGGAVRVVCNGLLGTEKARKKEEREWEAVPCAT